MKDGWKMGTISDIAEISPKTNKNHLTDSTEVSFIPMASVSESGNIIEMQVRKYSEVKSGFTTFEDGDVLFAKITPCMENGKGAHVSNLANGIGFGSTEFFVLRAKETACSDFLYQITISKSFRQRAKSYMKGTAGQQRVSKDVFTMLEFPIPPLSEQRRIAEILSAADAAIEEAERAITLSEEEKKGLMQRLIPDKEDELKDGWKMVQLSDCATITMGQSPEGKYYNDKGLGTPLINGPADYGVKNPIPKQFTVKETKLCEAGDLLFCVRGNTVAKMNVADNVYCIGRGVASIRGVSGLATTEYLTEVLAFQKEAIVRISTGSGTTFPNISSKDLSKISIPLPPLPEQKRIAEILKTADEKISLCKERKALLEKIKQGLMQKLLGKANTGAHQ